jgi:hypothetical protein
MMARGERLRLIIVLAIRRRMAYLEVPLMAALAPQWPVHSPKDLEWYDSEFIRS